MNSQLEKRCKNLLAELGIASRADVKAVRALAGGVASDIAMIDLGECQLCAKFALPKLKVAEDWHAPVHRNRAEYEWLRFAGQVAPGNSIKLFGISDKQHGFVMEYLQGKDVYVWKASLLKGHVGQDEASSVGDLVGRIHSASSTPDFDAAYFQNRDDFHALRIDPYLKSTARCRAQVRAELDELADMLFNTAQVLIHGDVSPKNILFRSKLPILLDAECATMGDASFDCAFCLNHLVLKALHMPESREELLQSVLLFWNAYAKHVSWETKDGLQTRVCTLLPALMLARVEGKSPVEYLDDNERERVRTLSTSLIKDPTENLRELVDRLASPLAGMQP